jgi:hypothetical protein
MLSPLSGEPARRSFSSSSRIWKRSRSFSRRSVSVNSSARLKKVWMNSFLVAARSVAISPVGSR